MDIKEIVTKYIEDRNKLIKDFNNKIKENDDKYINGIKNICPIKVGDIFKSPKSNSNNKSKLYRINEVRVHVDGIIELFGNRLTNKNAWAKNTTYLFTTTLYKDFVPQFGFKQVSDEEYKDINRLVENTENTNNVVHELKSANE